MTVAGIQIEIERKKIKHTHLAVYPPDARVHVSAPEELDERDIRSYVAAKLAWIREQRRAILAQPRQAKREYVSGESIYALGRRYRLWVVETSPHAGRLARTRASAEPTRTRASAEPTRTRASAEPARTRASAEPTRTRASAEPTRTRASAEPTDARGNPPARGRAQNSMVEEISAYGTRLTLSVRAGASRSLRERIVESWQRALLEECVQDKMAAWCKKLGREQPLMEIRKMRTKWASCLRSKGKIAFNAALARVPPRCIEYVVVHELTHFEVANHSKPFVELMDQRLPHWKALRDELNAFIGMPMVERP